MGDPRPGQRPARASPRGGGPDRSGGDAPCRDRSAAKPGQAYPQEESSEAGEGIRTGPGYGHDAGATSSRDQRSTEPAGLPAADERLRGARALGLLLAGRAQDRRQARHRPFPGRVGPGSGAGCESATCLPTSTPAASMRPSPRSCRAGPETGRAATTSRPPYRPEGAGLGDGQRRT